MLQFTRFIQISASLLIILTIMTDSKAALAREHTGYLKTHKFEQAGKTRRYMLYTPARARANTDPAPLVLVIHGGAGTDRGMLKLTERRWNELADEHVFFVAYPNAINRLWDFGEGLTSSNLKQRVNDLEYFERVMDDVATRRNIDQARVFATGISRGGMASFYLACNLPERMRAVMPVAMGLPKFMHNECVSGQPVGFALMNGTADPQVPYEGGQIKVFRQKRDFVMSAEDTLELWRARNGCPVAPTVKVSINKSGDQTSVDSREWSSCAGAPIKFYRVNNGGHTWPSGLQYLSPRIVGETSRDVNAADEAWAFFAQF